MPGGFLLPVSVLPFLLCREGVVTFLDYHRVSGAQGAATWPQFNGATWTTGENEMETFITYGSRQKFTHANRATCGGQAESRQSGMQTQGTCLY